MGMTTLVSLSEAAAYAAVHPRTVRRLIAAGKLTAYRLGTRILRVDLDELNRLLAQVPTAGGAA